MSHCHLLTCPSFNARPSRSLGCSDRHPSTRGSFSHSGIGNWTRTSAHTNSCRPSSTTSSEHRSYESTAVCCAPRDALRSGEDRRTGERGRRSLLGACLGAGALRFLPTVRPANAEERVEGLSLREALDRSVEARRALQDVLRTLEPCATATSPPCQADLTAVLPTLETVVRELKAGLPVVGAAAAYAQPDWRLRFRRTGLDPVVGAFALLDRAADGASADGPNRNISIADIERMERLEEVTQDTIDDAVRAYDAAARGAGPRDAAEVAGHVAVDVQTLRQVYRSCRRSLDGLDMLLDETPMAARQR